MWTLRLSLIGLALALAGCGEPAPTAADLRSRTITLPGGQKIKAEMLVHQTDIVTGARYRDSIPPDRGLLFMYATPGYYMYWMYRVKIPLDMIWMDSSRRIVEIKENAPPCPATSDQRCPTYGGKQRSQFVLEMAAGMVSRYHLQVGQQLDF